MAEIKIEKKKPIWPWILLAIIIIAVVAFFVYYEDGEILDDDEVELNDDVEVDDVDDMSTYFYEDYLNSMKPATLINSNIKNTVVMTV